MRKFSLLLFILAIGIYWSCKQEVTMDLPKETSFYIVGDWGRMGQYAQTSIAKQMDKSAKLTPIDFIFSTGDNFYENGVAISKNAVAIQPGKIDRSPTGTGCSARLALLHKKGVLKLNDLMIGRSIIDSQFECKIEQEVSVGDKSGIIPSIAGQAWITGHHQHTLDPTDPYPLGYKLSDTWPNKL